MALHPRMAVVLGSLPVTAAGTWHPLTNQAPDQCWGPMLLSDGTVTVETFPNGYGWLLLTPDIHGDYVNGTWSRIESMRDPRADFASDVLKDGRVFVASGEYGPGRERG
jgi:hypothetical protein